MGDHNLPNTARSQKTKLHNTKCLSRVFVANRKRAGEAIVSHSLISPIKVCINCCGGSEEAWGTEVGQRATGNTSAG